MVQSIEDQRSLFVTKIHTDDAEHMVRDVTNQEMKDAMFDIGENKAPGPDGYTSKFFKSACNIVGEDICKAIQLFFQTDDIPNGINATSIALVPKMLTPEKVSDYRPIACCNVVYKCISKMLTNRIKDVLGKIVNKNQSAFIPGRHISDNIMLTHELMRGYGWKYGFKRCALKIDLQKAYDTINWGFHRGNLDSI